MNVKLFILGSLLVACVAGSLYAQNNEPENFDTNFDPTKSFLRPDIATKPSKLGFAMQLGKGETVGLIRVDFQGIQKDGKPYEVRKWFSVNADIGMSSSEGKPNIPYAEVHLVPYGWAKSYTPKPGSGTHGGDWLPIHYVRDVAIGLNHHLSIAAYGIRLEGTRFPLGKNMHYTVLRYSIAFLPWAFVNLDHPKLKRDLSSIQGMQFNADFFEFEKGHFVLNPIVLTSDLAPDARVFLKSAVTWRIPSGDLIVEGGFRFFRTERDRESHFSERQNYIRAGFTYRFNSQQERLSK